MTFSDDVFSKNRSARWFAIGIGFGWLDDVHAAPVKLPVTASCVPRCPITVVPTSQNLPAMSDFAFQKQPEDMPVAMWLVLGTVT